jgi:hypothetical protein
MSFLDWIKRGRNEPHAAAENRAPHEMAQKKDERNFTKIFTAEWSLFNPRSTTQRRFHIGQSEQGFHVAIETSARGDANPDGEQWGQAHPTAIAATKVAWKTMVDADRAERKADSSISRISTSGWELNDDGTTERRFHIGQSKEGFHAAIETSVQGNDGFGGEEWGHVHPTKEAASRVARKAIRNADLEVTWGADSGDEEPRAENANPITHLKEEVISRMEADGTPAAKDKGHGWER